MGDWIWVLITALITFVGIAFINITPTNQSERPSLNHSVESVQQANSASNSHWQSASDSTMNGNLDDSSSLAENIDGATAENISSTRDQSKESYSSSAELIPWMLLIALPVLWFGMRVVRNVLSNMQRSPHTSSS